ncbi:hypothetical protein DID77_04420, partial [Candidatus Marinamargulisbacteria bacterium SCGC AG-439-L15]
NFLVVRIRDMAGSIVQQGLFSAPRQDSTTFMGTNGLSTRQGNMVMRGLSSVGSDDPLMVAFGYVILRSSNITAEDIAPLTSGAYKVLIDGYPTSNDPSFKKMILAATDSEGNKLVSQEVYNNWAKYLVCGLAETDSDLSDFSRFYYDANTEGNDQNEELAKAGGLMADIFIDAAIAAGLDLNVLQMAFDQTGGLADPAFSTTHPISNKAMFSMGLSMSSLGQRLHSVSVANGFSSAFSTLGASDAFSTIFNTALTTRENAFMAIEAEYADYFMSGEGGGDTLSNEIHTKFRTADIAFETALVLTDDQVSAMQTTFEDAGIDLNAVPDYFFTEYYWDEVNEQEASRNVIMTNAVIYTWLLTQVDLTTLTYARDTNSNTPTTGLNSRLSWMMNRESSYKISGDSFRTDFSHSNFSNWPVLVKLFEAIHEDMDIIFTRHHVDEDAVEESDFSETSEEMLAYKTADEALQRRLVGLASRISGNKTDGTAITQAEKDAFLRLLMRH